MSGPPESEVAGSNESHPSKEQLFRRVWDEAPPPERVGRIPSPSDHEVRKLERHPSDDDLTGRVARLEVLLAESTRRQEAIRRDLETLTTAFRRLPFADSARLEELGVRLQAVLDLNEFAIGDPGFQDDPDLV